MNAEEKVKQFMFDNIQNYSDSLFKKLVILIKEQDRATRHACAEAVLSIPSVGMTESLINKDAAHNACMNTKAV
jgi:hypothetical protein